MDQPRAHRAAAHAQPAQQPQQPQQPQPQPQYPQQHQYPHQHRYPHQQQQQQQHQQQQQQQHPQQHRQPPRRQIAPPGFFQGPAGRPRSLSVGSGGGAFHSVGSPTGAEAARGAPHAAYPAKHAQHAAAPAPAMPSLAPAVPGTFGGAFPAFSPFMVQAAAAPPAALPVPQPVPGLGATVEALRQRHASLARSPQLDGAMLFSPAPWMTQAARAPLRMAAQAVIPAQAAAVTEAVVAEAPPQHASKRHGESSPAEPPAQRRRGKTRRVYACDWPGCNVTVTKPWSLSRHRKTHTGARPWRCVYKGCGGSFAEKITLKRHLHAHLFKSARGRRPKREADRLARERAEAELHNAEEVDRLAMLGSPDAPHEDDGVDHEPEDDGGGRSVGGSDGVSSPSLSLATATTTSAASACSSSSSSSRSSPPA